MNFIINHKTGYAKGLFTNKHFRYESFNIFDVFIKICFFMKRILFLLLAFISLNVMAQEPYKVFCELVGNAKFMSTKIVVTVDFGQKVQFWSGSAKQYLVNDEGEKLEFNSMVDAMNYMGKRNWKFEQAYVVTASNQSVYHWLLSKEVTSDDQIKEGFMTKEEFDKKNGK